MTERLIGQIEGKRRRQEAEFTTTVRVSEFHRRLMGSIAKLEGINQSELVRSALEDYFEKKLSEYESAEGQKKDLANRVNEVTIYSRGWEQAMDNLVI